MNTFRAGLIIILIIVVTIMMSFAFFNLPKTIWLIASVSPYEQSGTGAGRILVLGDSTGYGTGASTSAQSVAGRMGADYPGFQIINDSVNGRLISDLASVAETVSGQHNLILLQIGANDILQKRDLETVRAELEAAIAQLETHTSHIIMLSSGNVGSSPAFTGDKAQEYESLSRAFIAMYHEVADSSTALIYIDLFRERSDDPFVINPQKYMAWDGLHPTGAGYQYWYDVLKPALVETLGIK